MPNGVEHRSEFRPKKTKEKSSVETKEKSPEEVIGENLDEIENLLLSAIPKPGEGEKEGEIDKYKKAKEFISDFVRKARSQIKDGGAELYTLLNVRWRRQVDAERANEIYNAIKESITNPPEQSLKTKTGKKEINPEMKKILNIVGTYIDINYNKATIDKKLSVPKFERK